MEESISIGYWIYSIRPILLLSIAFSIRFNLLPITFILKHSIYAPSHPCERSEARRSRAEQKTLAMIWDIPYTIGMRQKADGQNQTDLAVGDVVLIKVLVNGVGWHSCTLIRKWLSQQIPQPFFA